MRLYPLLLALTGLTSAVALGTGVEVAPFAHASIADDPLATPNDNRRAAGSLTGSVLELGLVARLARWRPERQRGPEAVVHAFAEEGRAPQIPGPLIRVPVGTEIVIAVRNALPQVLRVYGLQTRPADALDSVVVPPGESRVVRMRAGEPGTYLYWGRTTVDTFAIGQFVDGQLAGAIVVDSVQGNPRARPNDRILVMGLWQRREFPPGTPVEEREETLVFNGLAWPETERLHYTVGDSVHWRVINATRRIHPMHLHGFYYRIDARGTPIRDSTYALAQRRLAVTERMLSGSTMTMTWSPKTAGNWLFHCHLVEHISARMDPASRHVMGTTGSSGDQHALEGMSGLVLGIHVRPRPGRRTVASAVPRRKLRLFVTEKPRVFGDASAFSFVLQEGDREPSADSVRVPGSTIVLTRGEPVAITVVNRAHTGASVHWHGIELESFFDGVGGWSGGQGGGDPKARIAPTIAPGDSFVVRMTPDRAGTFIYHTHHDETRQLGAGLYGALLVTEPGQTPDPATDRTFLLGTHGLLARSPAAVNGETEPRPIELRAGTTYRLRFIGIAPSETKAVRLLSDTVVQRWRAIGKDGADLPAHQATVRPARLTLGAGETADFEYTPSEGRTLTLEIVTSGRGIPPRLMRVPVRVSQ